MKQRHTKILELLTQNKRMEVTTLSEILGVSQVTIRKDLDLLEDSGMLVREHGYAAINDSDDINHRLAYHHENKQKIAKMVASTIRDGETVMIESGSCCALVALEIAHTKKDVTLITNSAFIADYIRKIGSVKLILLGGEYQNEAQVMVGPITRKCAEVFFVDKLLIGIDGFTKENGFTGNDYMRCETVRDLAKQAKHILVVTDSTKFQQTGIVSLIDTPQVDYVYTDANIPNDIEAYLTSHNVTVVKSE